MARPIGVASLNAKNKLQVVSANYLSNYFCNAALVLTSIVVKN
jgi:hypothetical protein